MRWRRGHVLVQATRHGEPVEVEAARAVVTLPLGVMQLSPRSVHAVRFDPPLTRKEPALHRIGFGPVIKAHLKFRHPFWEELDKGRYRDGAFFLAPEASFPTFWSMLPWRTSTLVAWSAGRNATRLSGRGAGELIVEVMASLRLIFGRRIDYRQMLQHFDLHDWRQDDFACGAYSYLLAKGRGARRRLAEPIEKTLYFAGEATDYEGEAATVGGALTSGRRAAREILVG